MSKYKLKPKVNESREFLEIANDFTNPLELIREAISNSFDAKATFIRFCFYVEREHGEDIFKIFIEDDGYGMDKEGLKAFFDLGNSTTRDDTKTIAEKGHGTKVYFNSREIYVETSKGKNYKFYKAKMKEPINNLYDRKIPNVSSEECENSENYKGTKIYIKGYNNNLRDKFNHEQLKDYIMWSTKFGSFEREFGIVENKDFKLILKGVDVNKEEELKFGHLFPRENFNVDRLFDEYGTRAPDFYVRKWKEEGGLPSSPDYKYIALFYIEGDGIKREYNTMLRRPGYTPPAGAYTVAERYGLWLCKDFIPIQRKNEWIIEKGTEFVRFHAFFNLQEFRLTANRGSIENTPSNILKDVKEVVERIYKKITNSKDWADLEYLEEKVEATLTSEKEKKDYDIRIRRSINSKIAIYKNYVLVEPVKENKYYSEQGVYSLFLIINMLEPNLFPFEIIDYDTHFGIDVIVREHSDLSLDRTQLSYVEFKGKLTARLNHSFKYLKSIICWDTDVLNDNEIEDILGEKRVMKIISTSANNNQEGYTKYFLDNPLSPKKIEVFVLKDFLREKLGIEFRPRENVNE